MHTTIGSGLISINKDWDSLKNLAISKVLSIQYEEDTSLYEIYAIDNFVVYLCLIYKGTVPVGADVVQATNDGYKSDFETNYKPYANMPIDAGKFNDPRRIRKLGNLTSTSTSEVLVSARGYTELSSQRQCSVQSSSNQDKSTGTGSYEVLITYLDSNYVLKSENVVLNGTTKVNTVATDIRFIEKFEVSKGAAAAGAISLMDGTGGGASEFCGIASGTTAAFLCHHYVPAGKRAWITGWGATVDDECNFKLNAQNRFGSNLVPVIVDLFKLVNGNLLGTNTMTFEKNIKAAYFPEKTRISVSVVPVQATSTVIRAWLDIWEDVTLV